MTPRRLGTVLLLSLSLTPGAGRASPGVIGATMTVPVESHDGAVHLDRLQKLSLVFVAPPKDLQEALAPRTVTTSVPLVGYAPLDRDGPARYRRATFVMDYDGPQLRGLRVQARADIGPSPTPAQLADFVRGHILKQNLRRVYDIASVVAQDREGDCTEHAVLLTALLRAFGHAARVANGLFLADGATAAVGHSWSEVWERGAWRPLDSSVPPGRQGLYLPLLGLSDEGPDYLGALTREMEVRTPQKLLAEP